MRVLLVEDDRMIGEALWSSLKEAAYATDWVRDGNAAIAALMTHGYDLLLLDLGLPRADGHEVLAHLRRAHSDIPVLIVTARDSLDERVKGLDAGSDDYLTKPFDLPELLARMRALTRRRSGSADPVMSNGALSLDPRSHEAAFEDRVVVLSAREFALVHALLSRPGAILSRGELEERIYGWNEEVESNAVEYLIHSVRRKLGSAVIQNVRGVGWMVRRTG
jgi:two-component system OmpR family response regulator